MGCYPKRTSGDRVRFGVISRNRLTKPRRHLRIRWLTRTEDDVLRLVTIDLADADLEIFERYEAVVRPGSKAHVGRLELRVWALDRRSETHLLHFPGEEAFERFRSDLVRLALLPEFERSVARTKVRLVERI